MLYFNIKKASAVDTKLYKNLKQICRKMTGEQLVMNKNDDIVIGYIKDKPICFCNISMYSPGIHFDNEKNSQIPYLYNYISDISYKKYKAAYHMMLFIKEKLSENRYINLDIIDGNTKAKQFFERNNFLFINDFYVSSKKYHMHCFSYQT